MKLSEAKVLLKGEVDRNKEVYEGFFIFLFSPEVWRWVCLIMFLFFFLLFLANFLSAIMVNGGFWFPVVLLAFICFKWGRGFVRSWKAARVLKLSI